MVRGPRTAENSRNPAPRLSFDGAMGATIREVNGDLFSSTDSLAHCVSADLAMGRGIAVAFKLKFGGVQELRAQEKRAGEVATLQRDGRWIYYLVTKQRLLRRSRTSQNSRT